MSCKNDCEKPAAFPQIIRNRPGLPYIAYRIGTYADMRNRMLALLDQAPELAAWTHRGADDPGIALLEATAVVGDILTFYQQLYANELYLRTAQWRESVVELVRLLGYRLTPAIGGEATFAIAVKGTDPVVVPKAFGLKAQLEGKSKPADFESTQEAMAYPHLNIFRLYRPRHTPYSTTGTRRFYVHAPAGDVPSFKAGERVLLGQAYPSATNPTRIEEAQILIVAQSWQAFDTQYVEFTTPLKWSGSIYELQAYKLGEHYRHFGHNAPASIVSVSSGSMTVTATSYLRNLATTTTTPDPDLAAFDMPLDAEADAFSPGALLLIEARISRYSTNLWDGYAHAYCLVRAIDTVSTRSYTWGPLSAASTVLTLDSSLVTAQFGHDHQYADIRSFTFHQVVGAPFGLRAEDQATSATSGNDVYYYGTDAEVQALLGRSLLLDYADAEATTVHVTAVQTLSPADAARALFRRVTLDQSVAYTEFERDTPTTQVYGNLIPATQGKTQAEIVLGSGDRRQTFQTFALPKSPLTYLLDETRTPAQTPELTVYVDGIAWTRVDAFFNYGPDDAVYVVREDEKEKSYVQFGDGKTGRRLSSGLNNVSAIFRVGAAAHGSLKAGAKPSISGKLTPFDKLYLPGPVTVGTEREDERNARVAAPGKMQSLGRMVSLADIEAEALALPHVIKVRAAWTAPEGVPLVRLTVLTESGDTADCGSVRDSMQTYNRCRGPARYPIDVIQGIRQYVWVHVEAGYEAARRPQDVEAAIKRALGVAGEEGNGIDGSDGLFGLHMRQFGENAHRSQIIAAVQNAIGVTWVTLKAAQLLDLGSPPLTDPSALAIPTTEIVQTVLACDTDRLLALHALHLTVSLAKDEKVQECQV